MSQRQRVKDLRDAIPKDQGRKSPDCLLAKRELEKSTLNREASAVGKDLIYLHYCKNCRSVQKMTHVGPIVKDIGGETTEEIARMMDRQLYTCNGCKSTLSYKEEEIHDQRYLELEK